MHTKTKQNKRAQGDKKTKSTTTDYIDPDLIDFFGVDYKEIKTQTEKRNIHYCKKYCTD